MPFFKDLRRRSKANVRNDASSSSNESGGDANGTAQATKSSSTLGSYGNVSTAPSSLPRSLSNLATSNLNGPNGTRTTDATASPTTPLTRPSPISMQNKRYSMTGSFTSSASVPKLPHSLYAPRILSISENTWVHQKVFLVYGTVGQDQRPLDGTLTIIHHQDTFPITQWPVCASHFKALIHLSPGPNELRLDFSSPKLVSNNSSHGLHTSTFRINYLPLANSPPLHLVILLGKDSPGTFDATPEKIKREGNNIETAIRKYRMAGHLWSAFTAESMYRNGFGRRSFRLEEEWQQGTLSKHDMETAKMRSEAKVHVVRSRRTVAEIRDLNVAQQYPRADRKNDLYYWAMEDMKDYFGSSPGQTYHIALMLLDAHWDTKSQVLTGHAALGGGDGGIQLGIFGSHALHSYPISIEDVIPALTDCTRTNTEFVVSEGGDDSGASWQVACNGMGAHLHEVGHLLGCPHQSSGIMLNEWGTLNRTFLSREPYSTRTKKQGLQPCLPEHETSWHRLDTLRFRSHPCFRLVSDLPMSAEDGVQVWAIDQGRLLVTAKSGISFIEIFPEGQGACELWNEYKEGPEGYPKQILLTENELRGRLPPDLKQKKLRLDIFSHGRGRYTVEDVKCALAKVKMPHGQPGFLGPKYGESRMEDSQPQELLLPHAYEQKKLLVSIKVYHGSALDGLEFCYEDRSSLLFGKRGGQGEGSEFPLDTRRGETLTGFYLRAGLWVDGIAILTSLGRRSGIFGNASGGQGHTLMPPRGYSIAGVSGSHGAWIDGFAVIITR